MLVIDLSCFSEQLCGKIKRFSVFGLSINGGYLFIEKLAKSNLNLVSEEVSLLLLAPVDQEFT